VPNDDETLAHPEQPRFLLSAWLWAVVLFVFFGAIVAITFGTMQRGSSYEEERAKARAENLKVAEEEWNKTASSYGWVDKEKGVARVPIERAMELELADLRSKTPAPAGPIATPAPAEAPVASPGVTQPANPPNAAPPASVPNSPLKIRPVSPTAAPVQHPVGTALPVRGKKPAPTSPSPPKR
jgi:cbb3-type cytochrome oxidase subunit 3